jgi:FkbM family methyltransferase
MKIMARSKRVGLFRGQLVVPVDDLIGQYIIGSGSFERTQFDAIDFILNNPTILGIKKLDLINFVDVGANIGLYIVKYSPLFRQTLAIEASPQTYNILNANIGLNGITNCKSVNLGASDTKGVLSLKTPKSGMLGWARFGDDSNWEVDVVDVNVDTLDEICATEFGDGGISLIKIDVEGHEPQVLRGATKILKIKKPLVLFEVLNNNNGKQCVEILNECGYGKFFKFSRKLSITSILVGAPIHVDSWDQREPTPGTLICAVHSDL